MGITAPDPGAGGGAPPPTSPVSAGGGQGAQILQQVQQLLAQLMQSESDPSIQKGVQTLLQAIDPLMQAIGSADAQAMNSGLNTPGGAMPPPPGGDLSGGGGGMPPDAGGPEPDADDKTFGGARKSAMSNFSEKGHFSKKGGKGETLSTDKAKAKAKNRG